MSSTLLLCVVLAASRPQNPVDGDALRLRCDGRKSVLAVRLAGIDAPELAKHGFVNWPDQPFAREAAANLRAFCPVGSRVRVHRKGTDRYRRTLAAVECGGGYASEAQVRAGYAWAEQAPRGSLIPVLESSARAAHRGLWADAAPVKPADWRKGLR